MWVPVTYRKKNGRYSTAWVDDETNQPPLDGVNSSVATCAVERCRKRLRLEGGHVLAKHKCRVIPYREQMRAWTQHNVAAVRLQRTICSVCDRGVGGYTAAVDRTISVRDRVLVVDFPALRLRFLVGFGRTRPPVDPDSVYKTTVLAERDRFPDIPHPKPVRGRERCAECTGVTVRLLRYTCPLCARDHTTETRTLSGEGRHVVTNEGGYSDVFVWSKNDAAVAMHILEQRPTPGAVWCVQTGLNLAMPLTDRPEKVCRRCEQQTEETPESPAAEELPAPEDETSNFDPLLAEDDEDLAMCWVCQTIVSIAETTSLDYLPGARFFPEVWRLEAVRYSICRECLAECEICHRPTLAIGKEFLCDECDRHANVAPRIELAPTVPVNTHG